MFKSIKIKEVWQLIKLMKQRKLVYLITLIGCSVSFPAVQIIFSFVNKKIFNALEYQQYSKIYDALIMVIIIFVIACVIDPISRYINRVTIRKTMYELRVDLFAHIEKLSMKYFDGSHSGDLVSRITTDVNSIENAFFMYNLIECSLWGIGSAITMFMLDWRLALLMIVSGLLSTKVNTKFAGPIREMSDKIQKRKGTLTKDFIDTVLNIRTIKMFNLERKTINKYKNENNQLVSDMVGRGYNVSKLEGINFLISAFNLLGVILIGSFMVLNSQIDLGKLAAIVLLQNGVITMFLQIGSFFVDLQTSLAGTMRVYELLDQPHENLSYIDSEEKDKDNMILLKNISFGYDEQTQILNQINIEVKKGQKVAIVGESGSGKSTVFKLLAGFYSADSGSIYIDGKSFSEYTLNDIRSKISYVPQNAFLFQGTIEENIGYGKIDASREEIIEAAKIANAHEFIINRPQGYNTVVGENGTLLSGGQKQRITIARAILKNAPILLLDEPTSFLDSDSEQLVIESLNRLMTGRTVIIVAHRMATVRSADLIYVIDEGKVVESGSHDNLINDKSSKYRYLYNLHLKGHEIA